MFPKFVLAVPDRWLCTEIAQSIYRTLGVLYIDCATNVRIVEMSSQLSPTIQCSCNYLSCTVRNTTVPTEWGKQQCGLSFYKPFSIWRTDLQTELTMERATGPNAAVAPMLNHAQSLRIQLFVGSAQTKQRHHTKNN